MTSWTWTGADHQSPVDINATLDKNGPLKHEPTIEAGAEEEAASRYRPITEAQADVEAVLRDLITDAGADEDAGNRDWTTENKDDNVATAGVHKMLRRASKLNMLKQIYA